MLYEVYPDEAYRESGAINASHKWGLPGVKCSACQETWARTGLAYPSVDLSALPDEEQYRTLWPVSFDVFRERRQQVLHLIPEGTVPPPGTEFGPLIGMARGVFGDFAWLNDWTLLAQPQALEQLRTTEVSLPKCLPTLITFKESKVSALLELELEPRTMLAPSSFSSRLPMCNTCGRVELKRPAEIEIQRVSVPSDVDIFRDRLFSTLLLASDLFVEAVKEHRLTGLRFREVKVR